jgi:hypothetical protein
MKISVRASLRRHLCQIEEDIETSIRGERMNVYKSRNKTNCWLGMHDSKLGHKLRVKGLMYCDVPQYQSPRTEFSALLAYGRASCDSFIVSICRC